MRNTFKNHTPGNLAMPAPRAITFSLIEAIVVVRLGQLKYEVMVALAGCLLITAGWFFL
jgi:hypothetical protein